MKEIKNFKDIVVTNNWKDLLIPESKAFGRSYMWQCLRGSIVFEYAGFTYTMTRNDMLFSPANRVPALIKQSKDFRCIVFALDGKKVEDILYSCLRDEPDWISKLHYILRHPILHLDERQMNLVDSYHRLVHLYSDENGHYRKKVAFLQGQSIVYELLSWVDAEQKKQALRQEAASIPSEILSTSRINNLYVSFLQLLEHTHGKQRQVSWYASQLHISPAYLNRICHAMIGKSLQTMIQNVILRESCSLLRHSDVTVKQIAYCMNFSTEAAFCKYFRKQKGMTPSQFRANNA